MEFEESLSSLFQAAFEKARDKPFDSDERANRARLGHALACSQMLFSLAVSGDAIGWDESGLELAESAHRSMLDCLAGVADRAGLEQEVLRKTAIASAGAKNGAMLEFCLSKGFLFSKGGCGAGSTWAGVFAQAGFLDKARDLSKRGLWPMEGFDPTETDPQSVCDAHPFVMGLSGTQGTTAELLEEPFFVRTNDCPEIGVELFLTVLEQGTAEDLRCFFKGGYDIGDFFDRLGERALRVLSERACRLKCGPAPQDVSIEGERLAVVMEEAKGRGICADFSEILGFVLEDLIWTVLRGLSTDGVWQSHPRFVGSAKERFGDDLTRAKIVAGWLACGGEGVVPGLGPNAAAGMAALDRVSAALLTRDPKWLAERSPFWEMALEDVSFELEQGTSAPTKKRTWL